VKHFTNSYVSNRVLKLNVGFLLSGGPGHSHDTAFDVPAIRVAEDVDLEYIKGPVRLSRTKEGILLQGDLHVGFMDDCIRCLATVSRDVTIKVEELFTYPSSPDAEFSLHDDGILDLAPLIRAEVLLSLGQGVLCRPDCKGLCPHCGENLNYSTCDCVSDSIDPRLAQLKELLDLKR
jgi:uncharacterized protein